MSDNDGNKIIIAADLLNLINIMKDNLASLEDDGRFYEYDQDGVFIEKDIELPRGSSDISVDENKNFKSVFLSNNIKHSYGKLNIFDFFNEKIDHKINGLLKEKVYTSAQDPYLKNLNNFFEKNNNLFKEVMFKEYIKTYYYIYSLVESDVEVLLDKENSKVLIESQIKDFFQNKNTDFISINKNNFEENIEKILNSIINYSENIESMFHN